MKGPFYDSFGLIFKVKWSKYHHKIIGTLRKLILKIKGITQVECYIVDSVVTTSNALQIQVSNQRRRCCLLCRAAVQHWSHTNIHSCSGEGGGDGLQVIIVSSITSGDGGRKRGGGNAWNHDRWKVILFCGQSPRAVAPVVLIVVAPVTETTKLH
jgi:hypothetical protein